jgi:hypothetical protein
MIPIVMTMAAVAASPPERPAVEGGRVVEARLEKTIFQVDVAHLQLWLGPETAETIATTPDSLATHVADCRDAWAELRLLRGASLDRFLAGIDKDMRRARSAGLLGDDGYRKVAEGLPIWLEPLRALGLEKNDRFVYRIHGDTLRTVVERAGGTVVIDQIDVGPEHRRALLGSFVAPGAGFQDELAKKLRRQATRR